MIVTALNPNAYKRRKTQHTCPYRNINLPRRGISKAIIEVVAILHTSGRSSALS
jgi:hypothetical protein